MILVDTSAWIEFLRDTGSPVCTLVDELLAGEIAICDAVRMEVLAGARDDSHLLSLRRLLARATVLPTRRPTTRMPPPSIAVAGGKGEPFASRSTA